MANWDLTPIEQKFSFYGEDNQTTIKANEINHFETTFEQWSETIFSVAKRALKSYKYKANTLNIIWVVSHSLILWLIRWFRQFLRTKQKIKHLASWRWRWRWIEKKKIFTVELLFWNVLTPH